MPRFEPFSAVRYNPQQPLQPVIAPPYDVLSESDLNQLTALDPHNIVRIDVPRDEAGPERYEAAAEQFYGWISEGVFVVDPSPSFTLYRMSFLDEAGRQRVTVGVIGALEVVDEGAGGVLPHERTTPKAKSDRLDLTRATHANLSPIWGLSLTRGLSALLQQPGEPMGRYIDVDGVVHSVERVADQQRCAAISQAVGQNPVLIADGHHRYAISRIYRDEQRSQNGPDERSSELTMTYVGELVEEQLSVAAIHRLLNGSTFVEIRAALEPFFELTPCGAVGPIHAQLVVEEQSLCLVDQVGMGWFLKPRDSAFPGVRDLDSARLEHALFSLPAVELRYQHGVGNILEALAAGQGQAGVLLRPVSIDEIRRTANEGLLMPPKSTFFAPKLQTGLTIRQL